MSAARGGGFALVPSLLAADLAHLARDVRAVERAGADGLHIDIMDGHFVPNLSFGPSMVEAVRTLTALPLHVHLMTERPERYLDEVRAAGAAAVTVHYEACPDLPAVLRAVRAAGCAAHAALNPATPADVLLPYLDLLDGVLVMGVEPGRGGQKFRPQTAEKIAALRCASPRIDIGVDGGMSAETLPLVLAQGANVIVAGSKVFCGDIAANVRALRAAGQPRTE